MSTLSFNMNAKYARVDRDYQVELIRAWTLFDNGDLTEDEYNIVVDKVIDDFEDRYSRVARQFR